MFLAPVVAQQFYKLVWSRPSRNRILRVPREGRIAAVLGGLCPWVSLSSDELGNFEEGSWQRAPAVNQALRRPFCSLPSFSSGVAFGHAPQGYIGLSVAALAENFFVDGFPIKHVMSPGFW